MVLINDFLFGNLRRIWIVFFIYAAVSAFFLQLVVLPYGFPELHAGNGLWVGGDWVGFHQIAVELSEKIVLEGWSVWELRPKRQAPAGIAAVVYVFFGHHPWLLIPLNAAVHATTGLLLVCMARFLVRNTLHALVCAVPFVCLPSVLGWYAQIHKDGVYFLGILMCLYGWILMSRLEIWNGRLVQILPPLLYLYVGVLLTWIMRPYGAQLMAIVGFIFAAVLAPRFLFGVLQRKLRFSRAIVASFMVVALPASLGIFNDRADKGEVTVVDYAKLTEKNSEESPRNSFEEKATNTIAELEWRRTDWLPTFLDNGFLTISVVRSGYASLVGDSNIDTDVRFSSALEAVSYLPRALQIGLTAPFPTNWFERSVIHLVSAAEMVFVYTTLLFVPYALWRWRKRLDFWMMFGFSIGFIWLYAFITPNVGSLYRTRFGFLMLMVALGVSGAIALWQRVLARTLPNKRAGLRFLWDN